ncbi:MAG: polysaccharide biosynthesis tyrosine autokinase [Kiritimatiellaeota bacterium]|nr:polysaccharide biosynthesis tyrosine autokinase [Kiritimatiellota bacterium]
MAEKETPEVGLHFLDYWRVIRSRKEIVLAVALLVIITGAAYTLTLPKMYEAEAKISLREDQADVDVFERQNLNYSYNPYFLRTQFEIIQSRQILYTVIAHLNLEREWGKKLNEDKSPLPRGYAYRLLANGLRAQQYRDVYREYRLNAKRREMMRGVEALENELEKQQAKVTKAEEELEKVRKDLGITSMGGGWGGLQLDKQRISSMQADLIAARVDMLVRKARLDELVKLEGEDLVNAAAFIVANPMLNSLRGQIGDTEVSLKLVLESLGEKHPDVLRLKAGLVELRQRLKAELDGMKRGLESDYRVAKAKTDQLEIELTEVRKNDIESERERYLPYNRAERNLENQRAIMTALKAKLAQQGIEVEIPRTPVEVVDPAEPNAAPVSPNLFLNIVISVIVGFVAGIMLAYFLEYLDTSMKTVDDVEKALSLPVLGAIPQKVKPLNQEGPDSPHAEAYRILRSNMQFANKGGGGSFAFISGGAGEGKSTTLFNMAYVCAQQGDKVLIVDSDLRRPVQHTILGMSNRLGLTNVLMRDVPIEETIKPTSIPNLHLLPSGKLPKTAVGLLDFQRMRELVKNLKARYDYVFFDSPPIIGVTDASILASEVDGVMMIVQYRKFPKAISARAKRMIENAGGHILGVVLNNINIMRDDYYYYYHSYYTDYYYRAQESTARTEKTGPAAGSTPAQKETV